ncbi:MAG: hypothetical protein FJ115_07535 [Deltaproteobacteria bacterium]|nr:hypothetical protein [Deltaproteobacteria bacterium]
MCKFQRIMIVLSVLVVALLMMVAAENSEAQQYFFFQGKVESLYREQLTVKGDKGESMYFTVGRRTIYIPSRLPGVGERVKVTYFLRRGHNVASQVEILPPPSSPSPPKKK